VGARTTENGGCEMIIDVQKVGKRWFLCWSTENHNIEVEASYSFGTDCISNPKASIEAGYNVYNWVDVRRWILTGKGARKFREEIIAALNSKMEVSP
jgi:hypothetical protein